MTRALAAFRVPSYRYQWPADLLTSWAFEMETLILSWYVLVETNSVFLLSVFGALQFGGTLVSPYIGTLSDRFSRRTVLVALRVAYAVAALLLAVLGFANALSPVAVFVIGVVVGLVRPSDLVVRNSLIGDTVPEGDLPNAMGLSRTTMDSARVAGALAGAGLMSTLGFGAAYAVVTVFYIGSVLLTVRVARGVARATGNAWRALKVGLNFVRDTPSVLAMMWLAFLVNVTAFPISHGLLPYVAKDVYLTDENGLGQLMASYAVGALVGSLALAWSGGSRLAMRVVVVGILLWYVLLLGFAQTTTHVAGLLVLAGVGLSQSFAMISMSVALLVTTPAEVRGRIMGVRMLAVYGLPLGLLAGGALIDAVGFAVQATVYSAAGIVVTTAIAVRWRKALWSTAPGPTGDEIRRLPKT